MNPILASVFFAVVAVLAVASAQDGSCGCAPQSTIIQLSCGKGKGNRRPQQSPSEWNRPSTPSGGWDYATTPSYDSGYTHTPSYDSGYTHTPYEWDHASSPSYDSGYTGAPYEWDYASSPSYDSSYTGAPYEWDHASSPSYDSGASAAPLGGWDLYTSPSYDWGISASPSNESEYASSPSYDWGQSTSPSAGWDPSAPSSSSVTESNYDYYQDDSPADITAMCQFDSDGNPISSPPGGFPPGFRLTTDASGSPHAIAPAGYPLPPSNWDGRMETLGFEWPTPGTAHFNMFMCTPMALPTGRK